MKNFWNNSFFSIALSALVEDPMFKLEWPSVSFKKIHRARCGSLGKLGQISGKKRVAEFKTPSSLKVFWVEIDGFFLTKMFRYDMMKVGETNCLMTFCSSESSGRMIHKFLRGNRRWRKRLLEFSWFDFFLRGNRPLTIL